MKETVKKSVEKTVEEAVEEAIEKTVEEAEQGIVEKGKSRKLLVEQPPIGVLLKVSGQPSGQSSQTEMLKKWPICKMLGLSDPSTRNLTPNFSRNLAAMFVLTKTLSVFSSKTCLVCSGDNSGGTMGDSIFNKTKGEEEKSITISDIASIWQRCS